MTVRLVKRNQQAVTDQKEPEQPPMSRILLTTQSWVEEFKARKSRNDLSVLDPSNHN